MKRLYIVAFLMLSFLFSKTQNVGIGEINPQAKLEIKGTSSTLDNSLHVKDGTNTTLISVSNQGRLGINILNPAVPLHVYSTYASELLRLRGVTPYLSFYNESDIPTGYLRSETSSLELGTTSESRPVIISPAYTANTTFLPNGNVGIGTSNPLAPLHLHTNTSEILRLKGINPFISFYNAGNTYSGYLWYKGTGMELGTPSGSGLPVTIAPGLSVAASFIPGGNVGIGVENPSYRLDVNGRMRIQHNAATAGIWFNNSSNTLAPGFAGMLNDNAIGLYGTGAGWGLVMNTSTGNVGIGTVNPTFKLSVNGNIRSTEVVVETGWADYVFDENYKRLSLRQLEKFIQENKHLPNIPSAEEVKEKGLHIGDMQKLMMEKIEELTLYVIELKKEIEGLKALKK